MVFINLLIRIPTLPLLSVVFIPESYCPGTHRPLPESDTAKTIGCVILNTVNIKSITANIFFNFFDVLNIQTPPLTKKRTSIILLVPVLIIIFFNFYYTYLLSIYDKSDSPMFHIHLDNF